ncbi:MAG TPA: cupin domain-containing protein [Gemmatimonadaceae bacterium]|nr:cupin domain-containing protein [Gemmatimonadaceae bacterium]
MAGKSLPRKSQLLGALILVTTVAACKEPQRTTSPSDEGASALVPRYTLGSGFGGGMLGRGTTAEGFKLKRKNGTWEIDIHAKDPMSVAVQNLTFQPGGHSGWHSHPGPVFLVVTSGTLTFYESEDPSCSPTVRTVGQVYVESGEHSHIGRNEGSTTASAVATVFSPPGLPLRIDEPASPNCAP